MLKPRKYIIPNNVLHAGKNVIAVQIINYFDKGGIAGYKDTSRHISVYPVGDETSNFIEWPMEAILFRVMSLCGWCVPGSYQPFGDLFLQFKNRRRNK